MSFINMLFFLTGDSADDATVWRLRDIKSVTVLIGKCLESEEQEPADKFENGAATRKHFSISQKPLLLVLLLFTILLSSIIVVAVGDSLPLFSLTAFQHLAAADRVAFCAHELFQLYSKRRLRHSSRAQLTLSAAAETSSGPTLAPPTPPHSPEGGRSVEEDAATGCPVCWEEVEAAAAAAAKKTILVKLNLYVNLLPLIFFSICLL